MSLDYTKKNPDLEPFDLEAMADLGAHSDGSGGGIKQLAWEMMRLRETQERINRLNAFIRKHLLTLARLSWQVNVDCLPPVKREDILFVAEIRLASYTYDKKSVKPHEIAALWPDAEWSRSKPHYCSEEDRGRDYTAEIDGVIVRIENAERLPAPVKVERFAPCGPLKLPKPQRPNNEFYISKPKTVAAVSNGLPEPSRQ